MSASLLCSLTPKLALGDIIMCIICFYRHLTDLCPPCRALPFILIFSCLFFYIGRRAAIAGRA